MKKVLGNLLLFIILTALGCLLGLGIAKIFHCKQDTTLAWMMLFGAVGGFLAGFALITPADEENNENRIIQKVLGFFCVAGASCIIGNSITRLFRCELDTIITWSILSSSIGMWMGGGVCFFDDKEPVEEIKTNGLEKIVFFAVMLLTGCMVGAGIVRLVDWTPWIEMVIFAVCVLVGAGAGTNLEEQKKKNRLDQIFQSWAKSLDEELKKIENEIREGNAGIQLYQEWYDKAKKQSDEKYKSYFEERLEMHKRTLSDAVKQYAVAGNLNYSVELLGCIRYVEEDWEKVAELLKTEAFLIKNSFIYLRPDSSVYGSFVNPLDDLQEQFYMNQHADCMLDDLEKLSEQAETELRKIQNNVEEECVALADYLEKLNRLSCLLWYYAYRKPFDQKAFDRVCDLFGLYYIDRNILEQLIPNREKLDKIGRRRSDFFVVYSAEMVLARICAMVQRGGGRLVEQEFENYVSIWEEVILNQKDEQTARIFASGLAWMELYTYELEFLEKCVMNNLSLDEEMQERLRWLESGGIEEVNLYSTEDTGLYLFDSSSCEWESKKFETLFRKAKMKGKTISYALTLDSWNKAIPLQAGRVVDEDKLAKLLQELVNDYGTEVSFERVDANAVDLENIQYKNAFLFHMTGDRNKYGNMLLHLDKYGRNLNVTVLTLFDPVGVESEMLLKSVQVLKNNIYLNSFREAVLQCVDEVLKDDVDVYGE